MKKLLFTVVFFLSVTPSASAYYEFDRKLEKAYQLIFSLDFNGAAILIEEERNEKPDNCLSLLYLNYIDFLKAYISEDKNDFDILKSHSEQRLEEVIKIKENASSPFHLYVQSEIHIQQALAGIKCEENFFAAKEIKKAYGLIEKNEITFPTFLLNKKVSGFLQVVIGSVPSRFLWIVRIAGMKGSIINGVHDLKEVYQLSGLSEFKSYQTEILFYLGTIYSGFSLLENANEILPEMLPHAFNSQLIGYVCSNILMKQGKNDEAIAILESCIKIRTVYPVAFLYYKRGLARLRKMDLGSSEDFEYYLKNYKGRNSIKSAYQKLSWIALLKGDTALYKTELELSQSKGTAFLDEDKEASYEAASGEIINVYLMRARLFFDGGYYSKALKEIVGRKITDFKHFHDQLEITYRLGRIMQMEGQTDKAVEYFLTTLKNGASSSYHYAANSSLMLGNIAEKKNDFNGASEYYKKCLSLSYDRYKNSIDQKAKVGLERIHDRVK